MKKYSAEDILKKNLSEFSNVMRLDSIIIKSMNEFSNQENKIINEALENINTIMWETHMIKNHPVTHEDLEKIMIELEKWAEKTN